MQEQLILDIVQPFTALPAEDRARNRVKGTTFRFYVNRWQEHRDAHAVTLPYSSTRELSDLFVRALLYLRATEIYPNGKKGPAAKMPVELLLTPLEGKGDPRAYRELSPRFYIDKFVEHREALRFLAERSKLRDGNNTGIRALLKYQAEVLVPLAERRQRRGF